ncbi:MAG: DUF6048 family protein [Cyclobacteriaceae bacterium]
MRQFLFGNLLTGLISLNVVFAQDADTVVIGRFDPLALRVGFSLNNVLRTIARPNDTFYGFQADLVLGRYMLVAEYGSGELTRNNLPESVDIVNNPYSYQGQGSYFRIGPDVNLLINQAKTSFRADADGIFFGLRFARGQVTDRMTLQTRDDILDVDGNNNAFWPEQTITAQNDNLGVIWFEMTAGMKVQLYRNIFLGYNLRFKLARNFFGNPALIPYEVPGYGFGQSNEQFRFDYYLFYQIPFRKQERQPR